MDNEERDRYFDLVKRVHVKCLDISAKVRSHAAEHWTIEFTTDFKFRLLDHTEPKRDYGWFNTLDEVRMKLDRVFPLAGFLDPDH
jgi:hypothetical protein